MACQPVGTPEAACPGCGSDDSELLANSEDAATTNSDGIEAERRLHPRSTWRQYALAINAVSVASLIRYGLDPILGDRFPYETYILAVLFTARYGGLGPSIFAVIAGFLNAVYLFVYPRWSFEFHGLEMQVGTGVYLFVGICCALLSESLHSAQRRAQANAEALLQKQTHLEQEMEVRQEAQQACTKLLRRLVDAHEEERRRISRDLHDRCAQDLTALQIGLQCLSEAAGADSPWVRHISELNAQSKEMAKDLHDLALELRPPALDDLGLEVAVRDYLAKWSARTNIQADYESRGTDGIRLPDHAQIALYRTLQESLTNVARHANSPTVSVVLERGHEGVALIIEDQGVGFTADVKTGSNEGERRLGLLGMGERMEAVGGRLDIESTPGTGTTIYARVPLTTGA